MNGREEVLARVRAARDGAALIEPARDYRVRGDLDGAALLDLLDERLVDYRAVVRRAARSDLGTAIAAALADAGVDAAAQVVVPAGLPESWLTDVEGDCVRDTGVLTARDLDECAAVVTACRAACAETGTIVLDAEADQGRRAITLVPDVHVCVVRADQIVETVPELLALLDPLRPLTLISGPSATSDIELDRVEGVHGPRTLSVILATS